MDMNQNARLIKAIYGVVKFLVPKIKENQHYNVHFHAKLFLSKLFIHACKYFNLLQVLNPESLPVEPEQQLDK